MPNPKKNVEIIDDHIFQFSKEELLKILENAGFNILEFAYSSGVMNRHFNLMLNKK